MQNNISSFNVVYEYFGNPFWIALFSVSFIYVLLNSKPRTKKVLVISLIIFLVFFINPFILQNLSLSRQKVFYRFFWILPVLPMFGYAIILFSKKIKKKIFVFAIMGIIIIFGVLSGSSFINKANFTIPQNRYLLEDEILDVDHIIVDYYHDYDRITAVMPSAAQIKIRLYDTRIVAAIPRKVYLSFEGGGLDDTVQKYLPLIYVAAGNAEEYSPKDVKKALVDLNVDAIVVPVCGMADYMQKSGCILIGNTENYEIYVFGR